MATTAGTLVYKITGDSSGLDTSLKNSDKRVSSFGSSFGKLGGIIAGALTVTAIVSFTKSLLKSASAAEETANKYGVVFSSISKEANATANEVAKSYGLSNQAAKELISTTGNIAQSFGMTQKASLDLSKNITTLSADLVSFTNYAGGVDGASRAITSALIGEREALKGLGISITENELKNLAITQGKSIETMTAAQKATLTYELILSKAKNAVGDFQRSQFSFANQLRVAEANVTDLSASLGKNLIPFASLGLRSFNELSGSILESAEELNKFVTSAEGADKISTVLSTIAGAGQGLVTVYSVAGDIIGKGVKQIVESVGKLLKPFGDAGDKTRIFAQALTILSLPLLITLQTTVNFVKSLVNLVSVLINAGIATKAFVDGLSSGKWDGFEEKTKNVKAAVKDLGGSLKDLALDPLNLVKDAFDSKKVDALTKAISDTQNKVKTAMVESLTAGAGTPTAVISDAKEETEKAAEATLTWADALNRVQLATDTVTAGLSAFAQLSDALNQRQIDQLDAKMQKELEAAGVAEASTVMKAQSELDEAKKTGDAIAIKNAEDALTKSKIEEKYAKKKRQLEYEGAKAAWEFQLAQAIATAPLMIMNGFNAGIQAGPFAGPVLAGILAGVAGATAGVQIAAIAAAKPAKPKFANGGIVPGTSFAGDNVQAQVNSGEMVLTKEQQGRLFAQANGVGSDMMRIAPISKESILDVLFRASQSGELFISQRAVVAR